MVFFLTMLQQRKANLTCRWKQKLVHVNKCPQFTNGASDFNGFQGAFLLSQSH